MIKNLHHCMNRFIDRRFDQFFFQYTFQLENKIAQNHRQRKILQWTATWYRLRINSFWISFAFQNIIKSIGGNFFVPLAPGSCIQLCKCHSRKTINRKSTRLNSSHVANSYAVFCLKKKKQKIKHI